MDGRRGFLLDSAIVLSAQLLTKLRGLIALPLLVKGLGSDAYGTWAQVLACSTFLSAFFGLNLHLALIRFLGDTRVHAAQTYITLLTTSLVLSAFCGVAIVHLPDGVTTLLVGSSDPSLLTITIGIAVSLSVRQLNLNYFRVSSRLLMRSLVELLGTTLEVTGVILALRHGYGLQGALMVLLVIGALVSLTTTLAVLRDLGTTAPNWSTLRSALEYSLPLLPGTVFIWILDRSDRFFISHFLNQTSVGIYSAQYAISGLIVFAQVPLQVTLVPRVVRAWNRDRAHALDLVRLSLRIYSTLAIPFLFAAPTIGPAALTHLANSDVAANAGLNILLISSGLAAWGTSVLLASMLYGSSRTRAVSETTAVAAFLSVSLNATLVPRFGIVAAAAATAFCFLVTLAGFIAQTKSLARFDGVVPHLFRCVVASLPATVLTLWMGADSELELVLALLCFASSYFACLFLLGGLPVTLLRSLVHGERKRPSDVESAVVNQQQTTPRPKPGT